MCAVLVITAMFVMTACKDKKETASEYVPQYQKTTTNISSYYEKDESGRILPTAADRHDITVIEGGGANVSDVYGEWAVDQNTTYVFDGMGRGIVLTGAGNYTFVYSAQDGKLRIDNDVQNGDDVEYSYTIDGDKMYWERGNGQKFTLTKVKK